LIGWRGTETEAEGQGGDTIGQQEGEKKKEAWKKWGKEASIGGLVRKRKTGGGLPPRVPLSYQHLSTTQTISLVSITGCPLTIHNVTQHSKNAQIGESNKPGFSNCRLQRYTQQTPLPSKHHLAQMSWLCTISYKSKSCH
jgi:hypothetical protein